MSEYPKFAIVPEALQQWKNDERGSSFVYLPVLYVGGKLTGIDGVKQTTHKNAMKIATRHARSLWKRMVESCTDLTSEDSGPYVANGQGDNEGEFG